MKDILKLFQKLKKEAPDKGDGFAFSALPKIKYHIIGISQEKQPMFFIKCDEMNSSKSIDANLEFISVHFNRQCQLINRKGEIVKEDIYTIITLKNDSEYLQEYFIKILIVLINSIPEKPRLKDLKIEIDKLITLFTKLSKPALKTIQGLWAELLIIEQSNNPDYLIKSWHISTTEKYDFNDGKDKIEVKSTTKDRRIHNFSQEQILPNSNSLLIISSILIIETGTGVSIFDLVKKIESRVKDKSLLFHFNEMIATTLGNDFEKSFYVFFDYQYAVDSIRHYNSLNIPTINITCIPPNINNVRFECDLTDIKTEKKAIIKSKLYNAIF
jgi:hypothetical protein